MTSTLKASVVANRLVTKSKNFLRQKGYLSPFVFAVKSDGPFEDFEHEGVLMSECDQVPDELGLYRFLAVLRMQKMSDVKYQEEISRLLAVTTTAEMVGLVVTVYFKRYQGERPKDLNGDPEASEVLHACFYTRGDPNAHVIQVPYNNRGEIKGVGPEEDAYDVSFVDTAWVSADKENIPKIPYPFKD